MLLQLLKLLQKLKVCSSIYKIKSFYAWNGKIKNLFTIKALKECVVL